MNDWQAVAAALGVRRSTVFKLWNSGELGDVKIGARRFSTDKQLSDYIARLEAGNGPNAA